MRRREFELNLLLSGVLMGLFLFAISYESVVSRWGSFAGFPALMNAVAVWIVWFIHFAWILLSWGACHKRFYPWVWLLVGVITSFAAGKVVSQRGGVLRAREIQAAVDAGLREDCVNLLLNWPVKGDTILSESDLAKLPASIKMLRPAYVENDSITFSNLPPNVGICKNGLGGFAMGVRVFRSDQDANNFKSNTRGGCQRIAPGVYYWWHPT